MNSPARETRSSATESATARSIEQAEQFSANNYHPLPLVLTRGAGVWVWDLDGKRYLDMLSAYSALNQGHCHPRIVGALKEQADKLTLTSRAFYNDLFGPFCEKLCSLAGQEMCLPMNSGAEAVETAIKTARMWGVRSRGLGRDRAQIITCNGNFHGRTTTIVGFSSEPQYREDFGPYVPGAFPLIPYGDAGALERAITPDTVGFLVEPIQGESGIQVPPDGYLRAVADICRKNRVLLIADEIQTGLGRTGKLFCYEHDGVKPDLVIVGKALSGGTLPVSAVLGSRETLGLYKPGDHGSTFGGSPLACAVGMAAIDVIVEEKLSERSAELGEFFMERLRKLNSPHVDHVRGRGLLIGVVIKHSSGPARPFCEALQQEGILAKETHEQVIRFAPPLVVGRKDLEWALERIERVLA
ncbi:MAG: ornithine--oxo-acid transaminase [Acidobacteriota bacterium]